ncbi:single-stranded-DNA-specific exonuclease RecJ [Christensenellaceae bacterium OttesenSCG-928-K19]|nr:single-stranded-DNA-specific exonuclease RecJ [Christensenellaceae bacterium OttesenSCG-928-K19]
MKYILKQKQPNIEKTQVKKLAGELQVSLAFARVLCSRGIYSKKDAEAFLQPDKSQLNDPFLFCDMADSVSAIKNMISMQKRICIYGDYDVDGTAGCAILYMTLKKMGAKVQCILPSRTEHGYGLSMDAVENMVGYAMLITLDCGITNVEEIKKAKDLGLKTIVTDHHECGPVLPKADYILNPKRPGETYPYKDLCGAGVAFKLAEALVGEVAYEFLDLAAVATVADIVPLLQENRALSKLGIDKLNQNPNKGIKALLKASGIKSDTIDSQVIAYSLAPRINAAGRIASAETSFQLMIEQDEAKLEQLADELCKLNAERQARQERVVRESMEMQAVSAQSKLIFHFKEDWDVGIVGLAASKLTEKYSRPAVLFGKSAGMYTGSARSIDGINIYEALATQAELYEKFGGHAGAAGLTVKEENLETLKKRIREYLDEQYSEDAFLPVKYYDIALQVADVTPGLIEEFNLLRPFGHKNSQVEVLIRNADIKNIRAIGEDKHSKFQISGKNASVGAVYFGIQVQNIPKRADVVGVVQINSFDNQPQVVVSVLSSEPGFMERYEAAYKYVTGMEKPENKKRYFLGRERLLQVYTVLKAIQDHKIDFETFQAMLDFLKRHVKHLSAESVAFALALLEELNLLEIKKSDKISVAIHPGKHDLEESEIYNKFNPEGAANGFKSENKEY